MKTVIYWIGLFSYGFVLSHLAFFVHSWILLELMPAYNQPDPKILGIYSIYEPIIGFTGMLWFISIPIWRILAIVFYVKTSRQGTSDIVWKPLVLGLIDNVIAISFVFSGIVERFAD
jgi:hypothetical protein